MHSGAFVSCHSSGRYAFSHVAWLLRFHVDIVVCVCVCVCVCVGFCVVVSCVGGACCDWLVGVGFCCRLLFVFVVVCVYVALAVALVLPMATQCLSIQRFASHMSLGIESGFVCRVAVFD